MSIFNRAQILAMLTGHYYCSECAELMEFENENEDTLICPHCGHSVDLDHYGFENEEEYEALYPTKEEVCGEDDEDNEEDNDEDDDDNCGETYDEVCGELDSDD